MRQDFMTKTPKSIAAKAKINEQDVIKLNSFCLARETINIHNGGKFLQTVSDKGPISSNYKELKQIYKKKNH